MTTSSKTHHNNERCLARSRLDHYVQVGTLCRSKCQPRRIFSENLQKTATYRTESLSRQSLISALIDIQLISSRITATLINRGASLAIVPRARGRTGIDNLDDNAVPAPADRAALVGGTLVRDLVACAAVVLWATRS